MAEFDFHIRKSNQKGLMALLVIAIGIQLIYMYTRAERTLYVEEIPKAYREALFKKEQERRSAELMGKRFRFDPNRLSYYGLLKLGMHDSIASVVKEFGSEGGVFTSFKHFAEVARLDSVQKEVWSDQFYLYKPEESKRFTAERSKPKKSYPTPFYFDPNVLDSMGFVDLGFSPKQVKVILNYRGKRTFVRKEDFAQLYVVDQKRFDLLKDFIRIDAVKTTTQRLDVNACSLEQLKTLSGIGEVLGRRIMQEREELHGFVDTKQLKEVFGMDSLRWAKLKRQVILKSNSKPWVKINTMSLEELRTHPYISYGLAKEIVSFRENFRWFTSAEELLKLEYFPEGEKGKYLLPYISTEN